MSLILWNEAEAIVIARTPFADSAEVRPLRASVGRFSSTDIPAVIPNPRFANSAVDGYALSSEMDCGAGSRIRVIGEQAAGTSSNTAISRGECIRILTGAPIPKGTFAVVMQEEVLREGDCITLKTSTIQGANIRQAGTDIATGETLVRSGERISAESVALIASQGIAQVEVWKPPRVAILTTGEEVKQAGEVLGAADIYDSNSVMLAALVEQHAGIIPTLLAIGDDLEQMERVISELADSHDIVIVSGGASVGDYDFAPRAVSTLGTVMFHGVLLRPGKPVLFGTVAKAMVFGLPGNPASAFVGFRLFCLPAIRKLSGSAAPANRWFDVPFGEDSPPYAREEFVRCEIGTDGVARPVGNQGSFGLKSLAAADCLIRLPVNEATDEGQLRPALMLHGW